MECGLGEERHWGKLWLIPALIFGIGIFSTFFVTSSNLTASQVVAGAFGIENINLGSFKVEGVIVMGVLLFILTYVVTSGGTKKIASLFSKLVPFMSVLYILMGIGMIIININRVPGVFAAIVTNAFTGTAAIGGFAGCAVSEIIRASWLCPFRIQQRGRLGNISNDPCFRKNTASGRAGSVGIFRGIL